MKERAGNLLDTRPVINVPLVKRELLFMTQRTLVEEQGDYECFPFVPLTCDSIMLQAEGMHVESVCVCVELLPLCSFSMYNINSFHTSSPGKSSEREQTPVRTRAAVLTASAARHSTWATVVRSTVTK